MSDESFQSNQELDFKIIKKHYPRVNNDEVLEFVLEKDPNLFLRANKIQIKGKCLLVFLISFVGSVEIDEKFIVENGYPNKFFSMLTVEIESQNVSTNRNR